MISLKFLAKYLVVPRLGEPIYILNEHSFYYDPWNVVNFSIMIGSAGLDASLDSKQIMQYTGYSSSETWIRKKLFPPMAKQGELFIRQTDGFFAGTGITYASDWLTFYDEESNWLCVGDVGLSASHSIEFAKDTIACLKDEDLTAIWIKPRFVACAEDGAF